MSGDHGIRPASDHEEISFLLPWYVNGTIRDLDRQRTEAHLRICKACQEDLVQERGLYQRVAVEPGGVQYLPGPSLKRLQATLDRRDMDAPPPAAPAASAQSRRDARPWPGLLAASVALLAAIVGLFATNRWLQPATQTEQPGYHTVTTPSSRPPNEVIRAVFTPTTTLAELQAVLAESQLRIVSGPTEAGVYSLAPTSRRSVSSSLVILRRQAAVRFAESTQPDLDPGTSP